MQCHSVFTTTDKEVARCKALAQLTDEETDPQEGHIPYEQGLPVEPLWQMGPERAPSTAPPSEADTLMGDTQGRDQASITGQFW